MSGTNDVHADLPITITFNTDDLLAAYTGSHYDPDMDEEIGTNPLHRLLMEKVATIVAARYIKDEFRKVVRERIAALVDEAVREQLDQPFQPVDRYGDAKGKPTTLRSQIGDEIAGWAKSTGDSYNREPNFAKWVKENVNDAVKADLAEVLKPLREQVKATYKDRAADLLAATLSKS